MVRSLKLRKYLQFSLRSCFLVLTLLCIFAGYSAMCARRNSILAELLRRNSYVASSPRLGRLSIRVFPCAPSPSDLDESGTLTWNAQRPWWQHYVTWPVIEEADIVFFSNYAKGKDEWNQRLRPLLNALNIEGAVPYGDAVDDEAISLTTKLPITTLFLGDTELLTTKSLETIKANGRIKVLDAQPARFTTAELAPLRQSRKWQEFSVPAIDEKDRP
jgi:hypothetical protein